MLVFADGRTVGTIGGGCYENDAFWQGARSHRHRQARLVHYDLNDDFVQESGLICGGQMEVYIDPLAPVAARSTSSAPAMSAGTWRAWPADAGFRIHVIDDREKFANAERFPGAERSRSTTSPSGCTAPSSADRLCRRGHPRPPHDFDAVRALAAARVRYLGLIGSRAKVARIFDALEAEGMPSECLDRVHAPIGLDIGAVTPAEIAISILAELIAVRRGAHTADMAMKRPLVCRCRRSRAGPRLRRLLQRIRV